MDVRLHVHWLLVYSLFLIKENFGWTFWYHEEIWLAPSKVDDFVFLLVFWDWILQVKVDLLRIFWVILLVFGTSNSRWLFLIWSCCIFVVCEHVLWFDMFYSYLFDFLTDCYDKLSKYVQGFQPSVNIDLWKRKLALLLRDKEKQELISREKKDRQDFEEIAALASRMGLFR